SGGRTGSRGTCRRGAGGARKSAAGGVDRAPRRSPRMRGGGWWRGAGRLPPGTCCQRGRIGAAAPVGGDLPAVRVGPSAPAASRVGSGDGISSAIPGSCGESGWPIGRGCPDVDAGSARTVRARGIVERGRGVRMVSPFAEQDPGAGRRGASGSAGGRNGAVARGVPRSGLSGRDALGGGIIGG